MATTMTAPQPQEIDTGGEDALVHLVCDCDEARALCGTPVPDDCWCFGPIIPEDRCVVCWDLMWATCHRCGWSA